MIRFIFKVFKVVSGVAVFAPPLFDTLTRSVILHVFSSNSVHYCLFRAEALHLKQFSFSYYTHSAIKYCTLLFY